MARTTIPSELIADDAVTSAKIADDAVTSAKLDTNIAVAGTLASTGVLTANAGVVVDNITIDGTEIDLSSGDLILDVAGNLLVDVDNGIVRYYDAGTEWAQFKSSSQDVQLISIVQDKDIIFRGNDGGSYFNALTLDMSDAGAATFNNKIIATELDISGNVDIDGTLETDNLTVGGAQGSDGQVLTSTGSGVAWEDAAGGVAGISSSADATAITIDSSEQVGIGAAPNYTLGVHKAAASSNYIQITNSDTGSGSGDGFLVGVASDEAATIWNQENTRMVFGTNGTERMRITSDGDVNIYGTIGTNSSTVFASMAGRLTFDTDYSDTQRGPNKILLQNDGAWIAGIGVSNGATDFYTGGAFTFKTGTSLGTERMRIDSGGRVGIGDSGVIGSNTTTDLAVRKDSSAGRGGEISIVNYAASAVGNEAALNFGLESSTYHNNDGNAQIKARVMNASNSASAMIFSTWRGSSFNEAFRISEAGHLAMESGKRFYFNVNSIASGDTYMDEYSTNEIGITTGGSRKVAVSGGNLYVSGSVNANHNFSDERLKENIVVIPNALEKVKTLRGITFKRKADGSVGTGLIAQELEKVLPEAVYEAKSIESLEDSDAVEYKGIRYDTTVGLLVEAIKEQQTIIEDLKTRIEALEK